MKKKIKLTSVSDFPKSFIGISSHFKDFQVVWSVNNLTGYNFAKTEDFIKKIKNTEIVFHFSLFKFLDESNYIHFIIANKNKDAALFPKYKTIDFIYITNSPDEEKHSFIKIISKSKMINGSFNLPTDKLIIKTFRELFEE
ncbi:MAG: IPExxxVDY family protein [Bacteroidales bacterium]|nr:IPExxxVDY family protein [Bacteroidales bacterium]